MNQSSSIQQRPRVVPGPLSPGAARALASPRPGPLASVYIPLDREFPDSKQNAVRREHAAARLEERLREAGLAPPDAAERAARLLAVETDVRALEAPVSALGIFLDATSLQAYTLAFPVAFRVAVADHFALRPLLREAGRDHRYRVLALSVNHVSLYEGNARGLRPAGGKGLPESMAAALDLAPQPVTLRSRTETLSHDRAGGTAEREEDLRNYLRSVAKALEGLADPSVPLVLAADATVQGEFRGIARIPDLIPEGVVCNPDRLSPGELHERAWPAVRAAAEREEAAAAAAFERARNTGKGLELLDDVVAAALAGRVRRQWLDAEMAVFGKIDPLECRAVPLGEPDSDVLETLASVVLEKAGEVIVAEHARMPTTTGVAAELR